MNSDTSRQSIKLGISTCPNDTFAFHGILNGAVDLRGLDFEVELLDIQQLNRRLFAGDFDVAKASFHAALHLADTCIVLPSGSALGFGVGPLLLAAERHQTPLPNLQQRILCPGEHTTATLLLRLFYGRDLPIEQVVFSEIMPRLKRREADFGVCIHEGRFTWKDEGLSLVEDLGTRWEQETQCPLPLGGIVARRALPRHLLTTIQRVISDSIQYAMSDPAAALPTMRKFAQEFSDDVLMQHVQLYVNQWTIDLGQTGKHSLAVLSDRATQAGLVAHARPLEILDANENAMTGVIA